MLFDDTGLSSNTKLLVTTEFNEEDMTNDFYLCLSRHNEKHNVHNPITGTEIYVCTTDKPMTLREVVDIYLSQNYTPWEKEQRTHDFVLKYVENYTPPTRKKTYGRVSARGRYKKRPRET